MRCKGVFVPIVILFNFVQLIFAQDTIVLEHGSSIQSVVFSSIDDALLASAGGHNTIKLWHLRQNTVKELTHHKDKVNSVAFSPDGKLLASGSEDTTIKIWDVLNWESLGTLYTNGTAAIDFSPDGNTLVSGGAETNSVNRWRVGSIFIRLRQVSLLRHGSC